ncbi:MAG: segregation and condensation protein A [Nitrospinales bacterium]
MQYQFKLDVFEGPLDLLLHLIREQKMDLYDIPIAEITRQYLDYLNLMKELNLEIAGEYLVMAAEMTRIKSRILLPREEVADEPEQEGEDPRQALMQRLQEYQRYKDAAFELRKRELDRQQVFSRSAPLDLPDEPGGDLIDANVFDLLSAFQKVLKGKSFAEDYEIKVTVISVAEKMKEILEILNASESVTFNSLFTDLSSRLEVIAAFLALLELIRMKLIRSQQAGGFETIRIYLVGDHETQQEALRRYKESNPDAT